MRGCRRAATVDGRGSKSHPELGASDRLQRPAAASKFIRPRPVSVPENSQTDFDGTGYVALSKEDVCLSRSFSFSLLFSSLFFYFSFAFLVFLF